jgi:hypothetical protein
MRLIRLVPFTLAFGLVAACGGSDTSSGDDGPSVALAELPAKYADAFCQVFTACVGDLYDVFRPGETCSKDFTTAVEESLATLPDAVDAGRVKYHGTKVQKCLDEIAAGSCNTLSQRQPESCKAALEGTVEAGGDCTLDAECAGSQYCKTGAACPGVCAPYEKAGGACTSNDNCASGLKCGDNLHCVAPSQQGEACEQGEPKCADGLLCLGQDASAKTPGACYTIDEAFGGKAGDACTLGDGKLCASGNSCEITAIAPLGGTCVAKVGSGDACHAAFPDECPDDQYCALGLNPLMPGTCTAKPKAGEKCAAGLGDAKHCAPYTRCDADVCRDIAHAGEDCTADDTCYSGHCVNKACVTGNSCE